LDIGETLTLKRKGVPVDWAAPVEGMFMFDQTFSLLKHGPNKEGAYAFLDYMLSADVQLKLAREFLAIPVNTSVKISGDLAKEVPFTVDDLDKIVAFDWLEASRQRAAVIERWNRMVRCERTRVSADDPGGEQSVWRRRRGSPGQPRRGRGRVRLAARPVRMREDDDAPLCGGARNPHHGQDLLRRPRRDPAAARETADRYGVPELRAVP